MAEPQVNPHLIEAEQAVLGSILLDQARLFDIIDDIRPRDFYREAHQQIYQAALDLAERGTAIDALTVRDRLRDKGQLEDAGGPAYVVSLTDGVPRSTNVTHYAGIMREDAMLRGLIGAASRILAEARAEGAQARDVLDHAEKHLLEVAQRAVRGDFIDAQQLVMEGVPAIERLMEDKQGVTGVASGFLDFDEITRGFQPGALTLIAARPSMGKTAFALNAAYSAATHGRRVGFFSLEMSRHELFMRMLASVARVDGHRLQSGYLNQTDYSALSDGWSRIAESGLFVDDNPNASILDVRGKARRLQARQGLDLLVIDYLQLMQLPKAENRNLAVADVSRALKLIARELEIPVVALSQLSRGLEARGDKKPLLSDLRDSGALEQDADLVVFIHRPEVYEANKPDVAGLAEIIIAKHRNGKVGTVRLNWVKETTTFENRTRYDG